MRLSVCWFVLCKVVTTLVGSFVLHGLTETILIYCCSLQIQLKALQTLESVFQCREQSVSFPFINALAPHIVMILNDMCINKPTREDHLTVTLAAIKIMESLVELTEDHLSMYHGLHMWSNSVYNSIISNQIDLLLFYFLPCMKPQC